MPRNGARRHTLKRRPPSVSELTLPSGVVLFDLDHPCRHVYQLLAGRVQLSADGVAILEILGPGAFFGQQLLSPGKHAGRVAKAISPVKIRIFAVSEVRRRLSSDRSFVIALVISLVRRLENYEEGLRDFIAEPAQPRLARLLLRLAPRGRNSGLVKLSVSPSNPEFARMIGTTRGRVSHFLSDFRRLDWVRRQGGLWIRREEIREWLVAKGR
jgi:CRP/FNR family transcriptional regulator, cyclic AMP receptor protein